MITFRNASFGMLPAGRGCRKTDTEEGPSARQTRNRDDCTWPSPWSSASPASVPKGASRGAATSQTSHPLYLPIRRTRFEFARTRFHALASTYCAMAPYDDWNRVDDEEDEELQDTSVRLTRPWKYRTTLNVCYDISTLRASATLSFSRLTALRPCSSSGTTPYTKT